MRVPEDTDAAVRTFEHAIGVLRWQESVIHKVRNVVRKAGELDHSEDVAKLLKRLDRALGTIITPEDQEWLASEPEMQAVNEGQGQIL